MKVFFLISPVWFFGLFNPLYPQPDSVGIDFGYYHFHYNKKPDSVFIDGKPVEFKPTKKYKASLGSHEIRAVLDCHYPIEKSIKIQMYRTKPIRLKFKHLSTPERKTYDWLNWGNYATSFLGIASSSISSSSRRYALLFNLMRAGGHLIWEKRLNHKFDNCIHEYLGVKFTGPSFLFYFGLSSSLKNDMAISNRELFAHTFRIPPGTNYNLRWRIDSKIFFNKNSEIAANYSFNLGIIKKIYWRLSAKLEALYYPFAKATLQLQDTLYFYRNTNESTSEIETPFFIFGYDLNFHLLETLDQIIMLSIGGYYSTEINEAAEFSLSMPSNVGVLTDSTASYKVNINYKARNIRAGLHYIYFLSENISLYFDYYFNAAQKFKVNELEQKSSFGSFYGGLGFRF